MNTTEIINVAVPKFLIDLSILLNSTEEKIVANYMIWRVVKNAFLFLDSEARQITQKFREVLSGIKREPPRWETCSKITAGKFYLTYAQAKLEFSHKEP